MDELGAENGCARMNSHATDMILAREEAIYLENVEGRGPSSALEGPKTSMLVHKSYVVIVSPPFVPSASSASGTVRRFVASGKSGNVPGGGSGGIGDISRVVVFDIENRFIAYSNTFRETVREVFSCWGKLFILTNESTVSTVLLEGELLRLTSARALLQLYRLTEARMSAKLDMFYAKASYSLAISVALSQGLDEATIAEIHRRYGDQYYNAGDHEGAMNQYIQTIGSLQPSYVIRKVIFTLTQSTCILISIHLAVPRCSTNPKSRDILAGATLSWPRKLRPHHSPLECLYEDKRRGSSRCVHQSRGAQ